MTAKEKIQQLVETQPDDASYEEILRALTLERMIERGLHDARSDKLTTNEDMGKRIRQWPD